MKVAIDAAVARLGGLQVLVNNAGISGNPKPTDQVTEAEWDLVQTVNVKGVFFGTKHAIPRLRVSGTGSIINLSSTAGQIGIGGTAPTIPPRARCSKNDAITYAPEKIRVNLIHPAYIWTPIMEKQHLRATSPDIEAEKAAGAAHPIGAMGEPDNIVGAVVWLASDEAKFVTVAEIVIDGGNTAR